MVCSTGGFGETHRAKLVSLKRWICGMLVNLCIRKYVQMIENFLLYHFVERKHHYGQKTTAGDGCKIQCWLTERPVVLSLRVACSCFIAGPDFSKAACQKTVSLQEERSSFGLQTNGSSACRLRKIWSCKKTVTVASKTTTALPLSSNNQLNRYFTLPFLPQN